jgi:hypothetical protein
MKSKLAGASLILVAATLAASMPARAEVNIHVDIGNAPPPPRIVVRERPNLVYLPESRVYVVDQRDWGYDTFQCAGYWYLWNDGFWYRSISYRGPFVVIHENAVPAAIWRVPPARWRHPHGGPPGLARRRDNVVVARDRRDVIVVKEKRHSEHERDRGHGRGHDHD